MKIRNLFYILAAAAMFTVVSCKDEQQPEPTPTPGPEEATLSVAPSSVSYETTGSSKTLTVKSNSDWTVTVAPTSDWLTISPLKGSKDGTVTMTATTNVGLAGAAAEARECVVTVSVEGKKVDVKVSQAAEAIVFAVSGDTAEIPAAGGKVNVSVEYNDSYKTESIPEWITPTTKATATDALVFDVAANDKQEARQGDIVFKSTTGKTGKVTVKQAAAEAPQPSTDPYNIKNLDDLAAFVAIAKTITADKTVNILADLEIPAAAFAPIDTVRCVIDGQNHKITYTFETTESVKDVPANGNLGLFRYASGTIKNLNVSGSVKHSAEAGSGTYHIGGVVGYLDGTGVIENCNNDVALQATTKCTHHIGGIAGFMAEGAKISKCTNNAGVSMVVEGAANASQLGGIVGHIEASGIVIDCTNKGKVLYEGIGTPRLGGMCGYQNNLKEITFENCTNEGEIVLNEGEYTSTSWSYVGGLTGYYGTPTYGSKVSYINCINKGKISLNVTDANTRARVGGIASHGGITKATDYMNWYFTGCKNEGEIVSTIPTAKYFIAGGILGFAEAKCIVAFKDCEFSGKINGVKGYYGGIVGGTCDVTSTFENVIVTKDAVLAASSGADKIGAIGGNNAAYTTAVTGKVGAATLNGTALTADTYKSLLFGVALGEGGNTEGVVWDGEKPATDPDIPGVGYNDPGLTL